MATIRIDALKCIREQDFSGDDEPFIYIAGQQVWEGKMGRGDTRYPNVSRTFRDSVSVELKEKNGSNSYKSLGKWTIESTPTASGNAPLTATSSGYHYEVYYDVL